MNTKFKRQAVTGIYLNKGFILNDNNVKFSYSKYSSSKIFKISLTKFISSSTQKYLRMNSILDWNPQKDYDAV